MEVLDVFRIGLRWLHALSAVFWVGGSLFFWLVLRPGLQEVADPTLRGAVTGRLVKEFQSLVQLAIGVLVLTGAIIGADRLSQSDVVSPLYVGLLAVKVAVAVWMFWLALTLARRRRRTDQPPTSAGVSPQSQLLVAGLVVYLLADALKVVFEHGLRG